MKNKHAYISVKDHSVSGESFDLMHHAEYDILETSPQPQGEKLSEYYKSDDYISHTNSKRNLLELVYHIVRNISIKRKLKLMNSFQTIEKKLLDIGCGTGDFLQTAKNHGWQITGVEPSAKARQIANLKTGNRVYTVENLASLDKNSFDVITLWHVLEHLPNLEENIQTFKTLLKPNGRLVIAVPNFKSYDAKYYKAYWAAFDAPRHLWHFSKQGLKQVFAQENFEIEKTEPMFFDAYYVSLLSEKYKVGCMNPFRAFCIGWRSNRRAKRNGEYSSLIYVLKNV
jgi:2-polyprenyl-3-methyl-5-hydroxy-6-metoxy-1,4-benzoquinol methylase